MKIKHVYGNVLRLDIPLTVKKVTSEGGYIHVTEEPFYPDTSQLVSVELANKYNITKYTYDAIMTENVAHIEDYGDIKVGIYKVTVKCFDKQGHPYRYMARDIIDIVDATADAGIEAGIEFNSETHTLEGAVFISFKQVQADWADDDVHSKAYIKNKPTNLVEDESYVHTDNNYTTEDKTKLAGLSNYDDTAIRQWLALTVCGGAYNTDNHRIEMKDKEGVVLFSIDAAPFIKDGMISSVQVINGNLVITFNTDSGKEPITIPITDIFDANNYYTKNDIDLKFATIESIADMATKTWVEGKGYLTSFTEADPTVPLWAKAETKPSYNAQEVGALPNTTKYGSTIDLSMNSTTYVLTFSLKDQDGTILNTKTVDLPIESVVIDGRYDSTNKKIVLILQGGGTIDVPVGDLIAGLQTEITSVNMLDADFVDDTNSTHKFVTTQEKTTWNNKSDFSGSYNDLEDKPTIPDAQIQSDWNQTDTSANDFIKNKPTIPVVPTNVSAFTNDAGYLTQHQDISGKEDVTTIVAPTNETDATQPITALTAEAGKYYRIDVAVETLAITLPTMTSTNVKTIVFYLTGGTTPAVTFTSTHNVYAADGFAIEAGNTYEVNALWNGSAWIIASVEIDSTNINTNA